MRGRPMFRVHSWRRLARHKTGNAAIEFAIVLPILVAFLMGIIEFGMIFYSQNSAQNAARDVVRQIATNRLTADKAATTAKPQLAPWVADYATISVTQTAPSDPNTNQITVNISFPIVSAAPTQFYGWLYGSNTTSSRATMQQEAPIWDASSPIPAAKRR